MRALVAAAMALAMVTSAAMADELERAIRYVPISRDEWRQELVELAAANPGGVVNDDMASHISAVGQHVAQSGATIPGDAAELRRLTGVEPTTLREFIRANRDELSASDSTVRTPGADFGGARFDQTSRITGEVAINFLRVFTAR